MYVNRKTNCVQLALAGALFTVALLTHAQSVDEITDLKKKQLLAEMKKNTVEERPSAVVVVQQPKIKPVPEIPKLIVPDFGVIAIAGKNPAALSAVIHEGGSRNIRVNVTDTTPSGWLVERITPSNVTFSHVLPPKIKNSIAAKLGSKERIAAKTKAVSAFGDTEVEYQKITVGIGANSVSRVPLANTNNALPPIPWPAMVPAIMPINVLTK